MSEQQTINVPVSREEVYVERRPVGDMPASTPIGQNEDQTIRIPVSEEKVDVTKQTVVREELEVGKHVVQENEQFTDTVRHEEARIDSTGDVRGESMGVDDESRRRNP